MRRIEGLRPSPASSLHWNSKLMQELCTLATVLVALLGRRVTLGDVATTLGRAHVSPKQIFTCSSILASLSAESTPMGGYLSKVFSRVVT